MDDRGASLLYIPLKSKQGISYTREGRENRGSRRKEEEQKNTEEQKRKGWRKGRRINRRVVEQGQIRLGS